MPDSTVLTEAVAGSSSVGSLGPLALLLCTLMLPAIWAAAGLGTAVTRSMRACLRVEGACL